MNLDEVRHLADDFDYGCPVFAVDSGEAADHFVLVLVVGSDEEDVVAVQADLQDAGLVVDFDEAAVRIDLQVLDLVVGSDAAVDPVLADAVLAVDFDEAVVQVDLADAAVGLAVRRLVGDPA